MRECPCCGFKDPPYWRNVRYRLYTSYCGIDDLLVFEPDLYAMVQARIAARNYTDWIVGKYIYHIVKGNFIIQRIHIQDSRDGKTHREPEQEKLLNYRIVHPSQTKLCVLACNTSEVKK